MNKMGSLCRQLWRVAANKNEVYQGNGMATNTNGHSKHISQTLPLCAPGGAGRATPNKYDEFMRKTPPRSEWVLVTPELAQSWLASNTNNRNLDKKYAGMIADDYANDRTIITHQGVAFCTNGVLLDGQHRLTAVVMSGKPVWMLVTFGLPPESQAEIDNQKKRSMAATLKMLHDINLPNMTRAAAVAPYLLAPNGAITGTYDTKQKRELAFLEHRDAIEWALRAFPTRGGLSRAPVLAVIVRAYYSVDLTKLERFCQILLTGEHDGDPAAHTVTRLRDFLITDKTSKGSLGLMTSYRKTEHALYSYLRGVRLQIIREASGEMFPLPNEAMP